jgi:hypothetical protein
MAIAEYGRMRVAPQYLLSGPEWSPYYRALHHGEVTIAMLYQAYDLLRKKLKQDLFDPKDGSPLQRLNYIYNTSKHQPAEAQDPVWLSNDGFHAVDDKLLYSEFEDIARSFARLVEQIMS